MISLQSYINLGDPTQFKLHLACYNKIDQPLDVYVASWDDWQGWNEWRGSRNDFSRPRIFSLIDFYHEPNTWLFGGIFDVLERSADRYVISLSDDHRDLIGRLKVGYQRAVGRGRAFYLEKYLPDMSLSEILKERYAGEQFCGYENINHSFKTISLIVGRNRPDWKAALANVKGVYLITDTSTGKRYVGSAYGQHGIWSRWCAYIGTGHGWNDDLIKLIKELGFDHAREHFVFTLLEYRPMRTDDREILARETYWKKVMLSRGQFGHNKN